MVTTNEKFARQIKTGYCFKKSGAARRALAHPTRSANAHVIRRNTFKSILPVPNSSNFFVMWKAKEEQLQSKYASKKLQEMTKQRNVYWLWVDQILPRQNPFRQRMTELHKKGWEKVDKMKIFPSSAMQAFQWRSTHNKLYGRSDLFRFNYVLDPNCTFCGVEKQNIEHVYTDCRRIQKLFANFQRQCKVSPPLSEVEKLAGADSETDRSKLLLKRLGI
jgi:hypothetical protein